MIFVTIDQSRHDHQKDSDKDKGKDNDNEKWTDIGKIGNGGWKWGALKRVHFFCGYRINPSWNKSSFLKNIIPLQYSLGKTDDFAVCWICWVKTWVWWPLRLEIAPGDGRLSYSTVGRLSPTHPPQLKQFQIPAWQSWIFTSHLKIFLASRYCELFHNQQRDHLPKLIWRSRFWEEWLSIICKNFGS